MRSGKRTRYGRTLREFLVHWKGYNEPTWVDEADLNCGALLGVYDVCEWKRTRYGRTLREFLVHWKGYNEPTW
ncbi:Hypothetical protein PHPALM_13323, partial [Phytophthora palmivora]